MTRQKSWQVVSTCIDFLFLLNRESSKLHLFPHYNLRSEFSPCTPQHWLVCDTVLIFPFAPVLLSTSQFDIPWHPGISLQHLCDRSKPRQTESTATDQHDPLGLQDDIPLSPYPDIDRYSSSELSFLSGCPRFSTNVGFELPTSWPSIKPCFQLEVNGFVCCNHHCREHSGFSLGVPIWIPKVFFWS